jgi:DNA polymerase III subunit delta
VKLRAEQLSAHLAKSLLPMYWIAGDEPLLVQESADLIRLHCQKLGFSEREQFFVESSFDWQNLQQSGNNLSLFAAKKIIELRLRSAKLDDAAKNALRLYLSSPNPDNILLIISPKIESAAAKTKWFQNIEDQGAVIHLWPVDAVALPQWIFARLQRHSIKADREAVAVLADRVEGNLLAADQEIEKLALLLRSKANAGTSVTLDAETVKRLVANSSRYNVFALVDATLAGQSLRAIKMLQGLAADGSEPLMILAILCKELRSLALLAAKVESGQSIPSVLQSEHVWSNRKACVIAALERLNARSLQLLLIQAARVDQSVKGLLMSDPWRELSDLVLLTAGTETAVTRYASLN